jgi:trimethylamine--corrinoid protein Co-methyltransferase
MSSIGVKGGRRGIIGGQLKVLTDDQLQMIDYAAKEILWRTGIIIPNKDALEVLNNVGAVVDHKEERVWIPSHIVDEAVRKTPKGFRTAGRDPKKAIRIEGDRVYFVCGVGPYVVDTDGTMRKPTVKDYQDVYRVMDACENVDVAGFGVFGGPTTPEEDLTLPRTVRTVRGFLRALDWTEKPVDMTRTYVYDRGVEEREDPKQDTIDQINMEIAVRGSIEELRKLPMSFGMDEPVSPLMHETRQVDRMLVYARYGLPIFIGSETIANATGPATLAGTLALWTAETLSCLVLGAMAADPEHRPPALWITLLGHLDQLALTGPLMGGPEGALMQAACTQIAHYYGFPIRGLAETESKLPDAQAGYETAVSLLVMAMAGLNYNTSIGIIGPGEIGMSLEKIVLDNDLIGYIKRVMEGIEVSDETLAVDVIDEVGPGGTFLKHPHTRKWFRREQYFPTIFDRRKYEDWVRRGRKDATQRAHERVEEILRDYWPEPLEPDIRKRLEEYVQMVEKRETKKN